MPFAHVAFSYDGTRLDTHAGDLMEIDVGQSVSVQVDGHPTSARTRWTGESESSHHRRGRLDVLLDTAPEDSVTLEFEDIGVEERTLTFDLPPPDPAS